MRAALLPGADCWSAAQSDFLSPNPLAGYPELFDRAQRWGSIHPVEVVPSL
jgi:hypothetical protein